MKLFRIALSSLVLATLASFASAQQYMVSHLWGWEIVPPVNSPGIGNGYFTLDAATNTLHFNITHSALSSAETAATIHGPAGAGQNAAILFTLPLGAQKIGSLALTDPQEAWVLSNQTYLKISSVNFPAGEMRGQISPTFTPPATRFCFGDGNGTPCPCGNQSATGAQEGCLNSFGTGGKLSGSGVASVAVDSFALNGTGMTSATVLYFQGTLRINGGAGSVFGDGLRCAGGTVIRLGAKTNSGGASSYPVAGDPKISVRGLLPAGGVVTRQYQAWYRNVATFCAPEGFNLTNGVEVTWIP